MAMAALVRQLLHRSSLSHSAIRSSVSVSLQSVSYNFPFRSKPLFFSTDAPPKSAAEAEGVAPINSIEDAEQFASDPTDPGEEEDSNASVLKPRVANLPEDLTPEQLQALAKEIEDEDDEDFKSEKESKELAYPTLVKSVQLKKRNPVVLADAIREVKANARARFDETLEAHVRLGIDPRRSDQTVRGAATLPHGSGKVVRVAVFAEGAAAEEATNAGADVVGADALVAEIQENGGKLNFDKCIATPSFMPKLGKVARILGPRGLMPNPKVGTVTTNVGEAVRAAKQGRVDFRADKSGIVHAGLGKVSFKDEALIENIAAFTGALLAAKPTGLKKTSRYVGYVNSFVITSTMGAGVRVSLQSLVQAADNYSKSAESR
ncbi:unnamed protein product [Calypogeia fissa]